MVLKNFSKFEFDQMNTLDQMTPRKKNTYVATMCHFLIKNYLAHTKKEGN